MTVVGTGNCTVNQGKKVSRSYRGKYLQVKMLSVETFSIGDLPGNYRPTAGAARSGICRWGIGLEAVLTKGGNLSDGRRYRP